MDDWYVVCLTSISPPKVIGDSILSIRGYDPVHEVMSTPWKYASMKDVVLGIIPSLETNMVQSLTSEFYDTSDGFVEMIRTTIDHTLSPKVLLDLKDAWDGRYEEMVVVALSPKTRGSYYTRVLHLSISYHTYPYYVSEMARWLLGYTYGNVGYTVACKVYDAYKSF